MFCMWSVCVADIEGRVLLFYVEGVAETACEEHEGQDDDHDCQTRQQCKVGAVEQQIAVVLFHHHAPRWHRGLNTDAEEREACFEEYGAGEVGGCHHGDGTYYVGQYVAEDGAEGAVSKGSRGFDIFFLFDA